MKKIVIIGPESTGKTTLTEQLSNHFQSPMVAEHARTYLHQLGRPYQQQDLLEIAKKQLEFENQQANTTAAFLFCDTDLRVIKIWSLYKYGSVHPWIIDQINTRIYHAYLLMDIDLPWEPDPQREHRWERRQIFDIYRQEISSTSVPFTIISGFKQKRLDSAIDFITDLA